MENKRKRFAVNLELLKTVLISSGIWSLLAHGMALFNKYMYHDEAYYFGGVGATYESGRWMLGVLGDLTTALLGTKHYSLPVVNGVLTLLCIALISYILLNGFGVKSKSLTVLVCGMMTTFPAVTGIFGYMFTAPYYYFGALMGVVGAWIFHEKKNLWSAFTCALLMACSVGVYQANVPICICALLVFLIVDVYHSDADWKQFWKMALSNIAICVGFMAEYFLINRFFLWKLKIQLLNYKGINNFGRTSIMGYFVRVLRAYVEFLYPHTAQNIVPYHEKQVYMLLVAITAAIAWIVLRRLYKQNKAKTIQLMFLFAAYPLAAFFIYVMVAAPEIHGLMTFSEVLPFILLAWLVETFLEKSRLEQVLKKVVLVLVSILVGINIRYSNTCYLKAELLQSQAISYYTTLISAIQGTDGYTGDTPVVYIGEYRKLHESRMDLYSKFDAIDLLPYGGSSVINGYEWKQMMALWCGFSPELGEASVYEDNAEVAAMPCYPDKGSIKYIDGQIVVKFAEQAQ